MISVIVVDDELIIRKGIIKIINDNMKHYTVVNDFSNGSACLNYLASNKADLIICDIKMPVMNGIVLLDTIRERGIDTDFIFISGYDNFEYCKAAIHGGVFDYLLKPIDKTEFINVLKKYELKRGNIDGNEITGKKIIRDIKHYLNEHINERLSVEMIADKFLLSPNYLSHIFKTETGTTLTQYISNMKIETACIYLKDRTRRINEISDILGYSSAQMFANSFKKVMGVTPSEYREKNY